MSGICLMSFDNVHFYNIQTLLCVQVLITSQSSGLVCITRCLLIFSMDKHVLSRYKLSVSTIVMQTFLVIKRFGYPKQIFYIPPFFLSLSFLDFMLNKGQFLSIRHKFNHGRFNVTNHWCTEYTQNDIGSTSLAKILQQEQLVCH